jgi:rare lipoprotein A
MRRVLAQGLVALLLAASLGAAPAANGPNSKESSPKAYQVGKASWYGKYFHGKTTASGEPYNMFEFTAAHRDLPLGTWVRVTNLRNGKWVVLRVNDRGPYAGPSRIIDVSYGAAQLLGFRERGLTKVRLDIVEPEELAMSDDMVGLD